MKTKLHPGRERGISLVETVAAMAIIFAAMGGTTSLMLSYQLQNIRNEIRSGGMAAAEQVMGQLRQCPVSSLPQSGTATIAPNNSATLSPCGTTIPPLNYMGNKFYQAEITYCQNSSFCDVSTRQVQIQIFYENSSVFQAETIYTALQ